jgi:excisionase family DNA binding protein
MESLPPIMTVAQVQSYLGISRQKAYELVNNATFPALRLGKVIRIPREAFVQWIEQNLYKS